MRLMEGADFYQVAKNCRTSVEMIEKFYAAHIKNALDASAITVLKAKPIKRRVTRRMASSERQKTQKGSRRSSSLTSRGRLA